MKIEVDLEELLKLINNSVKKSKERTRIAIPSEEVTEECHEAYIIGWHNGYGQGVDAVIREIRVVTGMEEE